MKRQTKKMRRTVSRSTFLYTSVSFTSTREMVFYPTDQFHFCTEMRFFSLFFYCCHERQRWPRNNNKKMRRGCNDSWDGLAVPSFRFPSSFKCKKRRQMQDFCSFSCPLFPPVCLLDSAFFSMLLFIRNLPSFSSLLLPPGLTGAPEGNDRRERDSSTLIQMRVHETIK